MTNPTPAKDSLYDRVNRAKHRWLKRVMVDCATSSSEKCFAYIVMDRLNCVTLDCWPSQQLVADQFGWSTKTVHRVSFGLQRRGYLLISRNTYSSYRYKPIFLAEDEDKSGRSPGQTGTAPPDKNVEESSSVILITQSPSTQASRYSDRHRGFFETEVAKRLGNDGFEILVRLSEKDDDLVERLCRACADGELGERELLAARLAVAQLPRKRRPTQTKVG
jgi:hypothetical protein